MVVTTSVLAQTSPMTLATSAAAPEKTAAVGKAMGGWRDWSEELDLHGGCFLVLDGYVKWVVLGSAM